MTALAVPLLLGLAMSASTAHGEFFEYTTTVSIDQPSALPGGSTVSGNGTATAVLTLNNGDTAGVDTVTLAGTSSSGAFHENALPPGDDIVPVNISVAVNPFTPLTNVAFTFTYTLSITDYSVPAGGVPTGSASIQLTGHITGTVGSGVKVGLSTLTGYATIPANGVMNIGTEQYTVTPGSYTPPGSSRAGALGAHVQVPEPASAILLGVGGLGMVALARRRRQAKTAEA
jgi:hypothetical protein